MKTLVTFFSQTGNTEKIARAIYDAIDTQKDIALLGSEPDCTEYDLVFCGFPVHAHSVPAAAQKFITTLSSKQKLAIFSTHGSLRNNQLARTAIEHAAGIASQATVVGTFGCRGEVQQNVIDTLSEKLENRAWCEEAQSAAGHPDDADCADARDFARAMVAKARSHT